MSIRLAVVPGVSFLTLRVSLIDFGFFLVPAFVGVIFTVPEAGPEPMAVAATAMDNTAASAAIRYLRKGRLLLRSIRCGTGRTARIARAYPQRSRTRYPRKVSPGRC